MDRLALVAVAVGAVVAIAAWREPWVLGSGLALGAGGAALTLRLRDGREPRRALRWLLATVVVLHVARFAALFYESWAMGQLLAADASLPRLADAGRRLALLARVTRDLAFAGGLAFLGLAAWSWLRPGARRISDSGSR